MRDTAHHQNSYCSVVDQRPMLKLQLVVDVPRDRKAMEDAQHLQYSKSSHKLTPIAPGSSIRVKLPNQDSWTLGECTKKLAKRSYMLIVNGQMYRRSRLALRLSTSVLRYPSAILKCLYTHEKLRQPASCR